MFFFIVTKPCQTPTFKTHKTPKNFIQQNRDVTMHPELVENQYKYVSIQIGWDVKWIAIRLGEGVYINVSLSGTDCLQKSLDNIFLHLASV